MPLLFHFLHSLQIASSKVDPNVILYVYQSHKFYKLLGSLPTIIQGQHYSVCVGE